VYFPVKEKYFVKGKTSVSIWEQLEIAAQMQQYWADNQVSVTVTFNKETEGKSIKPALELYETRLKSVSFLPLQDHKYKQAPYQEITEQEYEEYTSQLKPMNFKKEIVENIEQGGKFCDGDSCLIK
jgi:ribonucleoside-triphosphate reductase